MRWPSRMPSRRAASPATCIAPPLSALGSWFDDANRHDGPPLRCRLRALAHAHSGALAHVLGSALRWARPGGSRGISMSRRRVVITGMGLITALGNDVESSWAGMLEG